MLTFSICVLFQTSSKKAYMWNKQTKHKQLDNLTKQSSVKEMFTISEDNWIKKRITPQNACEKNNNKLEI